MRSDRFVDGIWVRAVGETDVNIGVLEPETRVYIRGDFAVCFYDILDVYVNKVVERVDVLLDETLDLKKRGQQQPFVLIEPLFHCS